MKAWWCLVLVGMAMAVDVSVRIVGEDNDLEEDKYGNVVDSTDLELGTDEHNSDRQVIGLRWPLNVPPGATIFSACVQFRAKGQDPTQGTTNLLWNIHDTANSAPMMNPGDEDEVSSRPVKSSLGISETITLEWVEENDYCSVDLSPLIQHVVDKSSWSSGNYVTLIIYGSDGSRRRAFSYNTPAKAPMLRVSYEIVVNCGTTSGVEFSSVFASAPSVATACDTNIEAPCSLTCLSGYLGSPLLSCSNAAEWTLAGTCSLAPCSEGSEGAPSCDCSPGHTGTTLFTSGEGWSGSCTANPCPALPPGDLYTSSCSDGSVSHTDTCALSCVWGYVGTPIIYGCTLGDWNSSTAPLCTRSECPPNAELPECACSDGFFGSPSWDFASQTWLHVCTSLGCDGLPSGDNYSSSCLITVPLNSTCSLACNYGYRGDTLTHLCRSGNNISSLVPSCELAACPEHTSGATCQCISGYKGSPTFVDGEWVGECTVVPCLLGSSGLPCTCDVGYSGTPTFDTSTRTWSSCAVVPCMVADASGAPACACDTFFSGNLTFDETARTWDGACEPLGCGPIEVGSTWSINCSEGVDHGDTCEIACGRGFSGSSVVRTCDTGRWDSTAPPLFCSVESCPSNSNGAPNCYCANGYLGNLSWSAAQAWEGECTVAPCPANSSGGPSCSCNAGFRGNLRFFASSGAWTGECTPVPCPPNAHGAPACRCNAGYVGAISSAFNAANRTWTDVCTLQSCPENARGAPSCQCEAGFRGTPQFDSARGFWSNACQREAAAAVEDESTASGGGSGPLLGVLIVVLILACAAAIAVGAFAAMKSTKTKKKAAYVDDDGEGTVKMGSEASMKSITTMMLNADSTVQISEGTSGVVYKALGREGGFVALKKIKIRSMDDYDEFHREVSTLSTLLIHTHPNVIALKFIDAESLVIAMEYADHGSLYAYLLDKSKTDLPSSTKAKFAMQVASGVAHLHSLNLAHLDVKTKNILLMMDLTCKVTDFGVSTGATEPDGGDTMLGYTPRYCSPERYRHVLSRQPPPQLDIMMKWDVFSFALVLWCIHECEEPYSHMDVEELRMQLSVDPGKRPPVPTDCTKRWEDVMTSCWDADPAKRPRLAEAALCFPVDGGETSKTTMSMDSSLVSVDTTSTLLPPPPTDSFPSTIASAVTSEAALQ